MKAFEVYLNGKLLTTAGTNGGVLAGTITWVKHNGEDFHFRVGGIDGQTDERLDYHLPSPHVGDEITIRLIETDRVDPPGSRKPRDPALGVEVRRRIEDLRSAADESTPTGSPSAPPGDTGGRPCDRLD